MFDNLSLTIICVAALFALTTLYFLGQAVYELITKRRQFTNAPGQALVNLFFSAVLLAGFGYCLYHIPDVFFGGTTWHYLMVMGPINILVAVASLAGVIPLFYLYFLFTLFFTKAKDTPYFLVIVLSIISGFGNSLLIFIINETLNRSMGVENRTIGIESGLYIYFILGIMLFTLNAMVVRKKLITLTNDLVYEKRIQIIDKILQAPYSKLESVENGKIHAVLNNDTEAVSGFVNMFVAGLTGLVTMITCFIYLGTMNVYGLLASIVIITFAVFLFLSASQAAEKLWQKNRDIQNQFFKYINDLINGFKELYINRQKRREFQSDIHESCFQYRRTRVEGDFKFIGVSITGELLFTAVIGAAVFLFPLLFPNLEGNTLRSYVLVFLYMGGVVNSEIYLIPNLVRVSISWRRINDFLKEISMIDELAPAEPLRDGTKPELKLELQDVCYEYKNTEGEKFTVGPISYEFKAGEIVFITGGNGSGKSTLAKILTGLYPPDEGEVRLNKQKVDPEILGNHFATVFSDFYLFDKLYGINYEQKQTDVRKYLELLRISDKLQIREGGVLSTLKLSTGQRKRLALLISYLEDRPACLFDEWAADQDPEFRMFFYHTLLPELKAKGKLVIAITHDDRYFHLGDRVIKMELGKIVDSSEGQEEKMA